MLGTSGSRTLNWKSTSVMSSCEDCFHEQQKYSVGLCLLKLRSWPPASVVVLCSVLGEVDEEGKPVSEAPSGKSLTSSQALVSRSLHRGPRAEFNSLNFASLNTIWTLFGFFPKKTNVEFFVQIAFKCQGNINFMNATILVMLFLQLVVFVLNEI